MNLILFTSVVLQLMALFWALGLLHRLRDWRLGVLAAMIGLLALRQTLTLAKSGGLESFTLAGHWDELPAFLVAFLSLLAVYHLGVMIEEHREVTTELKQREKESVEAQRLAKLGHWLWAESDNSWSWCSEGIPRVFGIPEGELLGPERKFLRFVHPTDRERLLRLDDDLIRSPHAYQIDFRVTGTDGEEKILREVGEPIFDDSGRCVQYRGTTQDITELKRAEEEAHKNQLRLRNFAKAASDLFWETDANLRYTYCSVDPSDQERSGGEEYVGKSCLERKAFDVDQAVWSQHLSDLSARRPFRNFVYSKPEPDGKTNHYRSSGQPIFDDAGEFQGYRGVASNITAEVLAEQERVKAELRLARAIETIPASFALYDDDDTLVISNRRYRQRLEEAGLDTEPGANFSDLLDALIKQAGLAGSESEIAFWSKRRQSRRAHDVRGLEFRRANGRWESVSDYELDDGSVITISTDVTERKVAEEAAEQSQAKLRQTQSELFRVSRASAMGQISSAIAHEINQPLTAIRNYVQAAKRLSERDPCDDHCVEFQSLLGKASEQTDRAAMIIRGLRNFIERRDSQRSPEDLNVVITDAVDLALTGIDARHVRVCWKLAPELADTMIDKVQIAQVVINLVRNALDAMAGVGTPYLIIGTYSDGDGMVRVNVSDCGSGLTDEVKARLFQPFVTTKSDSMGIGLSVSHTIVAAHGGELKAEDNPQGGTVFSFTLPIAKEFAKSA